MRAPTFSFTLLLATHCLASPTANAPNSLSVQLTSGNFLGANNAATGIDSWLGVPFAQPPVGSLRFKAPVAITRPSRTVKNATQFGNACPQLPSGSLGAPQGEDCLVLNVFRPNGTTRRDELPVLVWFYVRRATLQITLAHLPTGWWFHERVAYLRTS